MKRTKATKAARAVARNEIESRRRDVERLARRRMTGREIARELNVSPATVCRDLAVVREAWLEDAKREHGDRVAEDLEVLAQVEGKLLHQFDDLHEVEANLLAFFRSLAEGGEKDPKKIAVLAKETLKAKLSLATVGLAVLKVQERRARLIGLDAPTKTETKVEARVEPVEAAIVLQDPEARRLAHELAVKLYGPKEPGASPPEPPAEEAS